MKTTNDTAKKYISIKKYLNNKMSIVKSKIYKSYHKWRSPGEYIIQKTFLNAPIMTTK